MPHISRSRSSVREGNSRYLPAAIAGLALSACAAPPQSLEKRAFDGPIVLEPSECSDKIIRDFGKNASDSLLAAVCENKLVPEDRPVRLLVRVAIDEGLYVGEDHKCDAREKLEKAQECENVRKLEEKAKKVFDRISCSFLIPETLEIDAFRASSTSQLGPFFSIPFANSSALRKSLTASKRDDCPRDYNDAIALLGISAPTAEKMKQSTKLATALSFQKGLEQSGIDRLHSGNILGKDATILVVEDNHLNRPENCFGSLTTFRAPYQHDGGAVEHLALTSAMFRSHAAKDPDATACDTTSSAAGMTPMANLLVANIKMNSDGSSYVMDYITGAQWAMQSKKRFSVVNESQHSFNVSMIGLSDRDKVHDWAARHCPWPTIVIPAGNINYNTGDNLTFFVNGRAFNALSAADAKVVGRGTAPKIVSTSSYKNPHHPSSTRRAADRELPLVAGPGSSHADVLGSNGYGATSAATTVIASVAALLHGKSAVLSVLPEATRAIVLAGAVDQSSDKDKWQDVVRNYRIDGEDGVGHVDADLSLHASLNPCDDAEGTENGIEKRCTFEDLERIAGYDHGRFYGCTGTDNNCASRKWILEVPRNHAAKLRNLRVVFTWNSRVDDPTSASANSSLDANIDLKIKCPGWGNRANSRTKRNNYEMVECKLKPGEHEIIVTGIPVVGQFLPADFHTNFGVAWTAF